MIKLRDYHFMVTSEPNVTGNRRVLAEYLSLGYTFCVESREWHTSSEFSRRDAEGRRLVNACRIG
ncbi:MAG: hypothetical protein ACI9HK_002800, partial [Pirellulaceae bacterium]